ncbi:transmembrane signal receptor [Lithospermum erythrorhizon]|uniref:Transmembrane signal receptor n=1 Tax=Lithospermum erythrorhizon TaxID=34254 RepID=A0AAV3RNM8_LITER
MEEVYMKTPEGIDAPPGTVCRLKKSLYGLKQASRQWFSNLNEVLLALEYVQSENDYSLYIKHTTTGIVIVVYVDDILLTGSDTTQILHPKQVLDVKLSIKDVGQLHFFLGFEIGHVDGVVTMSQCKFANELIEESGILQQSVSSKLPVTPLPLNTKLFPDEGALLDAPEYYRGILGKLNFLTNKRHVLSFAVQTLSQFMQHPRDSHLTTLTHLLHYVKSIVGQGIIVQESTKLFLAGYSDSDWVVCRTTRRSVTGYIITLGNSPISYKSKKQTTISRSSSEAEYRVMAQAGAKVTWLVRLLQDLGVSDLTP